MKDRVADPLTEFRASNVDSTLQLAACAAAAGVRRFVFISSVKVNGESTAPGHSFSESDMAAPSDSYAVSKWEAEQGLRRIAVSSGMEVVIVRPPLVYGAGVKANFASLMRAVQRGVPFPLGSVHNLRSLVGLDNLVDFIMTCVTCPPAANHTFLVSDGVDVSTPDLILAMARAARCPARVFPFPLRILSMFALLSGQRSVVERLCGNLQVDISKAREILGWLPPFTLDEGLRGAFEGYRP
jgi:nucleoside-diphosphate-sugar epimerase